MADFNANHRHVLGFHDKCRPSRCKKPTLLSNESTEKLNKCLHQLIENASVNPQYAGHNHEKVREALQVLSRNMSRIITDETVPLACRTFLKEKKLKLFRNIHAAFRLCDSKNLNSISQLQDDLKNMTKHITEDHFVDLLAAARVSTIYLKRDGKS
jgi:uncharacterized protein (UPF0147 family)